MDGAVEAGERAAREVLHAMSKIGADEIHQEEPPSQEVVAKPCEITMLQKCLPSVPTFLVTVTALGAMGTFLVWRHLCK